MKHGKNVTSGEKIGQTFGNAIKKKSVICFQRFGSCDFFGEALQPAFFARKMTLVKNDDR
jgi:hypothetical protein